MPSRIDEILARAVGLHRAGNLPEAARCYQEILAMDPRHADAWHLLGMTAHGLGDQPTAARCVQRAIALSPGFADYHNNLATIQYASGDYTAAEASCRTAIGLRPAFAQAHNNLGNALLARGDPLAALDAYRAALEIDPRYARALVHAASARSQLGDHEGAAADCRRALQLDPSNVDALQQLGEVHLAAGEWGAAEATLRAALARRPDSVTLLANLGMALRRSGRWDEASACYKQALRIEPHHSPSLRGEYLCQRSRQRFDAAEQVVRRALDRYPDDAGWHNDLGELQWRRQDVEAAIASFRAAIARAPLLAVAHFNLANALHQTNCLDEAVSCYRRALGIDPRFHSAMTNLAIVLGEQGRVGEAAAWFEQIARDQPRDPRAASHVLVCSHYLPGTTAAALAAQHAAWNRQFAEPLRPAESTGATRARRSASQRCRLRVGFVSRDFRSHPVGHFLVGLLEARDRKRLEVVCYSDHTSGDRLCRRIQAACDQWLDVKDDDDDQLARRIAQDGLDLLVDLAGHTAGNRLLAFARRPAPVQATWMGYVGTTGLTAMDFLISDRFHTPPGCDRDYCERIIRLPHGYVCYLPPEDAPPVGPVPANQTGEVTLGCFNNPAKISDDAMAAWGQILQQVPRSRLLLKYHGLDSGGARDHLLPRLQAAGVAPDRVLLEGASPWQGLMRRYHAVDLALDTFPYSGGLTTCEALWMGVPVVTWPGETFASRHAFSHLCNAGASELIAASSQQYVEIAVAWASDLQRLESFRAGLRDQLIHSPLCDAPQFADHWTSALEQRL